MKRHFLTAALAATVIFSGLCSTEAAPCKVGENSGAPVQCAEKQATPGDMAKKPDMRQKPTPEQMKAMMEKRVEEFNKALGLTDAQVAQAKDIRAKGHEKMKPLIQKKKAKIDEIRAVMDNDDLTVKVQDKKIETLRNELKVIDQDIRQMRRDNEKEFVAILTPEQKVKYEQIKQEGRKHYKEHRMPQGPENFHSKRPMNHPMHGSHPMHKMDMPNSK